MFDRDRFIEDCLAALQETNAHAAVKEVVARAVDAPGEVADAFGPPAKGGIQTLYRSSELTVLNVVWAPRMQLYPHNHETWAVIGIYTGQEDNSFYRRRPEGPGLDRVNGRSLLEKDVISLGDQVIHAVTNPRLVYTSALHVYGGDFFALPRSEWGSPEAAEQPYSVEHALQAFEDANRQAAALLRSRA